MNSLIFSSVIVALALAAPVEGFAKSKRKRAPKNPCGSESTLSSTVYSTASEAKSSNFSQEVAREGSGINRAGQVVNQHGQVDSQKGCNLPAGLGFGPGKNKSVRGAAGCVIPFFTIAADLTRTGYQAGDVIYIPEVAKAHIKLPNGKEHPGYFIVQDTGGAFRGAGAGRFDFYTGMYGPNDKGNLLTQALPWLADKNSCSKDPHKFQLIPQDQSSVDGSEASYGDAMAGIEDAIGGPASVTKKQKVAGHQK